MSAQAAGIHLSVAVTFVIRPHQLQRESLPGLVNASHIKKADRCRIPFACRRTASQFRASNEDCCTPWRSSRSVILQKNCPKRSSRLRAPMMLSIPRKSTLDADKTVARTATCAYLCLIFKGWSLSSKRKKASKQHGYRSVHATFVRVVWKDGRRLFAPPRFGRALSNPPSPVTCHVAVQHFF